MRHLLFAIAVVLCTVCAQIAPAQIRCAEFAEAPGGFCELKTKKSVTIGGGWDVLVQARNISQAVVVFSWVYSGWPEPEYRVNGKTGKASGMSGEISPGENVEILLSSTEVTMGDIVASFYATPEVLRKLALPEVVPVASIPIPTPTPTPRSEVPSHLGGPNPSGRPR